MIVVFMVLFVATLLYISFLSFISIIAYYTNCANFHGLSDGPYCALDEDEDETWDGALTEGTAAGVIEWDR